MSETTTEPQPEQAQQPGSPGASFFPAAAVAGASSVPAYALVFLVLLVILAAALQAEPWLVVLIAVVSLALGVYVIWMIEYRARRSVATPSTEAAERLAEVRDLDRPSRCVLESLSGDGDVYLVYSSTEQREFVNQLEETVRPGDLTYGTGAERRATAIPDAIGAGHVQTLLYVAGKREKVHPITSWPDDFRGSYWAASLVLLGSGKSNRVTTRALRDYESPYTFADDFNAIVGPNGKRWPASEDELRERDYAILVKLKGERAGDGPRVYIVAAGVGPNGTLAACLFLRRSIQRIYEEYDTSPFAYVLSVTRDALDDFDPRVEAHCPLPVVRR